MTYDLALYPAPGPGYGHLMRCYALAEAATRAGAKPIVCLTKRTRLPERWPCAVALASPTLPVYPPGQRIDTARVAVSDGRAIAGEVWRVVDALPVEPLEAAGYIYPHFGALPVPGYPTLYGQEWMPLRDQFGLNVEAHGGETRTYRFPGDEPQLAGELAGDTHTVLRQCSRVIVPPSLIAYEAMALRVAVQLHGGVKGYEHIAAAMVEAGAASRWPDLPERPKEKIIDGKGAARIIEALL